MIKKILGIVLTLLLLSSTLYVFILPVFAAGTTSVTVIKYDTDGETVLEQYELLYSDLEAYLTVQGDGVTHYYHQGPTFDPENLWDEDEDENLKDKGALKGTDLKDICGLVGGMSEGDEVKITAIDNFNKTFDYANVYTPAPQQGKMVVCWYEADNGGYVPDWNDGMMLVCFAQTTNTDGFYVFGNWDMHEQFPEERWHYYSSGGVDYPSTNGYTIKNIATIEIYSGGIPEETLPDDTIDVTTDITIPTTGIALSTTQIDYGELEPGENSDVEVVTITNIGSEDTSVSLEVIGDDETAQDFYEQALYVDGVAYLSLGDIAIVGAGQAADIDTQLIVPADWDESGTQDAYFIFWAETIE